MINKFIINKARDFHYVFEYIVVWNLHAVDKRMKNDFDGLVADNLRV